MMILAQTISTRMKTAWLTRDQAPDLLLLVMVASMPLSFGVWQALLNNFTVEYANFQGDDIGLLQSVREIPGFLAFTAAFLLIFMKEQFLALFMLILLGLGTALTGFFPSLWGLLITTTIMSVGFHYYETYIQSLSMQYYPKDKCAEKLGLQVSVRAFSTILVLSFLAGVTAISDISIQSLYVVGGAATIIGALIGLICFPAFKKDHEQQNRLVIRKQYSLYYLLTFLSGARRQIFVVFAGFLMVEKFGYTVEEISLLLLANAIFNFLFAKKIGRFVGRIGDRASLLVEYSGLILIFLAYAFVENSYHAAILYILDHLFFALAIAQKTYFQKIARPEDIVATAGVSFSINHVAAVVIPVSFGMIWLVSPGFVFIVGAVMAAASLGLSLFVPTKPAEGMEWRWLPVVSR